MTGASKSQAIFPSSAVRLSSFYILGEASARITSAEAGRGRPVSNYAGREIKTRRRPNVQTPEANEARPGLGTWISALIRECEQFDSVGGQSRLPETRSWKPPGDARLCWLHPANALHEILHHCSAADLYFPRRRPASGRSRIHLPRHA